MSRKRKAIFKGKVHSIAKRLQGKRGPVKYAGKDRRYSRAEALRSARRIAGARTRKER